MDEEKTARLHAYIEGRVQGVGFRAFVQREAVKLGLTGWVRNRWDRTVETVAEGPRSDLESFLSALHRGPRASNVTGVRVSWGEAEGGYESFRSRMTV